ncbi:helix-turn-helix domain-containing protein [Streptomyces sp. NPDC048305]|uniref:helix-turn-helix domain-containing protein n=1 Tax=Streptomyces sp. NPDC048305 TaxID=3365532 RepID=UPI00371E0630
MATDHGRLVAALRELRAGAGLSLAALAERTAYSKSSWERYLNGKSMPPRQAVRDLCRLVNEPDGRMLALWEIAESQWTGRAAAPAHASAPPADVPPQLQQAPPPAGAVRRLARGRLLPALAAYTLIVGGAAALLFLLLPGSEAQEGEVPPSSLPFSLAPQCHGAAARVEIRCA